MTTLPPDWKLAENPRRIDAARLRKLTSSFLHLNSLTNRFLSDFGVISSPTLRPAVRRAFRASVPALLEPCHERR